MVVSSEVPSAGGGSGLAARADLDRLAASTATLVATLASLTDEQVRGPSLLPGWTRGHVLTHVARNADGMGNLVSWAVSGVRTPMYPSAAARSADIDAGAARPAKVIVADLRESAERLGDQLTALYAAGPEALTHDVVFGMAAGPGRPADQIAPHRRREVEVHHADLALGFTSRDWPADFVRETLDDLSRHRSGPDGLAGITTLVSDDGVRWSLVAGVEPATPRDLAGPAGSLAAWLLGRAVPDPLATSDGFPVPPPPSM